MLNCIFEDKMQLREKPAVVNYSGSISFNCSRSGVHLPLLEVFFLFFEEFGLRAICSRNNLLCCGFFTFLFKRRGWVLMQQFQKVVGKVGVS